MRVVNKLFGSVECCMCNVRRGLFATFDIEVEDGLLNTQGLVQTARPMPLAVGSIRSTSHCRRDLSDSPSPVSDATRLDRLWQTLPGNAATCLDHSVEVVWTGLRQYAIEV